MNQQAPANQGFQMPTLPKNYTSPPVRCEFAKVFEPHPARDGFEANYSITAIFEEGVDDLSFLETIRQFEEIAWQLKCQEFQFMNKGQPQSYNSKIKTVEENGKVIHKVSFKTKAEQDGNLKKIPVFDNRCKPFPADGTILIGNGSKVKISFSPKATNSGQKAGLSLYLQAVQVKELIKYNPKTPEAMGFKAEETGFSLDDHEIENACDNANGQGQAQAPAYQPPQQPAQYQQGQPSQYQQSPGYPQSPQAPVQPQNYQQQGFPQGQNSQPPNYNDIPSHPGFPDNGGNHG